MNVEIHKNGINGNWNEVKVLLPNWSLGGVRETMTMS